MSCTIRKATPRDLPRIREIYEMARQFMRKNGNHSQWGKGDEPEALIEGDICQGNLRKRTFMQYSPLLLEKIRPIWR